MATINRQGKLISVPSTTIPHHSNPFLSIDRQTSQLQKELQVLLNAQGAGLFPKAPDSPGNSITPLSSAGQRTTSTNPVNQPLEDKLTLYDARVGLLDTMDELLTVREEERRVICAELQARREAIADVDAFKIKEKELQAAMRAVQGDPEAKRAENLKNLSYSLEKEMMEIEHKLAETKAYHQRVFREIMKLESSVDSKLSSYKWSIEALHKDILEYLQSPPLHPLWRPPRDQPNFYSLRPNRRTLDMAKEHWKLESAEIVKRRQGVEKDINAITEGVDVWRKITEGLTAYEKRIREQISLHEAAEGVEQTALANSIEHDMDNMIIILQDDLEIAREKNWTLLICSISAELETVELSRARFQGNIQHDEWPPTSDDSVPGDLLAESPCTEPVSSSHIGDAADHTIAPSSRPLVPDLIDTSDEELLFSPVRM
ncbi:hypothetical protein LOZ58_001558 [Ophidiomyces ophidiicola]|nr:hypothetical protein LOZ65_006355 [Ophidiomyces ophidiicola]KAI1964867.1 hypothetical protein LOZ58_001558 [Ophidiomyces ophidiicola]